MPVLLYGCETWTLTSELKSRLNAFGTRSLRRIMRLKWSDFVSNDVLLKRCRFRHVTCLIRERQLRSYGHIARFDANDPARKIISARDPRPLRNNRTGRSVGRPRDSWLRQVGRYCNEMGMGQAEAWGWASSRNKARVAQYRGRVDAAKRCSGVCPHT